METNMEAILADASISITELKRNPSAVIEAADGESIAVLVHNRPSAYLVPADTYKRLLERLEDLELAELVRARAKERRIKVKLDEL
jgi:antitoxin StbD